MSATKYYLEKNEYYRKLAYEILLEMGDIKTCDFHDDYYYSTDGRDEQSIYSIATKKLKEKYPNEQDFSLFHAKIKQVLQEAGNDASDCPRCEKYFRD